MQIVVLADERLRAELKSGGVDENATIKWISKPEEFLQYSQADACIDLLFENHPGRIAVLQKFLPRTVIINSVEATLSKTDTSFVRINGWNSFLKSSLIEASAVSSRKPAAEQVFRQFHKKIEWLPDEPGFVTARVVSMIINEAHHALAEHVSTKEEIDTAMKLGTNYPYGPFQWAEEIGIDKVRSLLATLAKEQPHYEPSSLL
jgi:3-hydroxybutyryl-CoA dehydrogenase